MDNQDKVIYKVLDVLERHRDSWVSGAALAASVGVSRNAIWKSVNELIANGYPIESSRRGYRLALEADVVSAQGIGKYLRAELRASLIEVCAKTASTNNDAKALAGCGAEEWRTVVAEEQSAGRGRQGKNFYSGRGDGIYFSFVLRPHGEEVRFLTVMAAVATARAIRTVFGSDPKIKWVNDVYVNGKKCVGILTEAIADLESMGVEYAVVGIGINVREPRGGYPDELRDIAGVAGKAPYDARNRIVAEVLNEYYKIYAQFDRATVVKEYASLSFLEGKKVIVIKDGSRAEAKVLRIDEECRLVVDYGDRTEVLASGEVSLKVK